MHAPSHFRMDSLQASAIPSRSAGDLSRKILATAGSTTSIRRSSTESVIIRLQIAWVRGAQTQLFQLHVLFPVRLAVQGRRNELLLLHLFAVKVLDDCLHRHLADLFGVLDGVGVNLAVPDRLLAVILPVE